MIDPRATRPLAGLNSEHKHADDSRFHLHLIRLIYEARHLADSRLRVSDFGVVLTACAECNAIESHAGGGLVHSARCHTGAVLDRLAELERLATEQLAERAPAAIADREDAGPGFPLTLTRDDLELIAAHLRTVSKDAAPWIAGLSVEQRHTFAAEIGKQARRSILEQRIADALAGVR